MYKNKLFIFHFFLLVAIAVLQHFAIELYWYWIFPWFDLLMHFLGGLWVSTISLWFFFESGYVRTSWNVKNAVLVTVIPTFFLAIGWEVFELVAGVPVTEAFVPDTITDLIMDSLGAFVGWFYYKKVFSKDE